MFLFKSKAKNNLENTLKNFLSFMLLNYQKYSDKLSSEYSNNERHEFLYNCALNTIDEYIANKKYHKKLYFSTKVITDLFKENFLLKQFEYNNISVDVPSKISKIIDEFKYLKEDLSNTDKNYIMKNVDDIIASTI